MSAMNGRCWLVDILNRLAMLAVMMAACAHAAPPVLDIASEPLTAACRVASSPAGAAEFDGASLLRVAPPPASASAGDLFQASIDMADWSGHFSRYVLSPGGAGSSFTPTAMWDAGALLTGDGGRPPSPAPAARKIFTAIVQPNGALEMIPFEWSVLSVSYTHLTLPTILLV